MRPPVTATTPPRWRSSTASGDTRSSGAFGSQSRSSIGRTRTEQGEEMSQGWPGTGAARGLGMAIAQAALEAGHQLVATARDTGNLGLTFRHVPVHRLLGAKLDVSDLDQAHQVARAALDTFGRVDVLVNNAGYGQLSAFEETAPDEVRAQLDTNLFGVMNVTRAVSPLMRAQRAGRIFNVASIGGYGSSN